MPNETEAQPVEPGNLGFLSEENILHLKDGFIACIPDIVGGLLVIFVFWLLALTARWLVRSIGRSRKVDVTLTRLMGKAAFIGMLGFGIVTGLGTMGIDIGALVAGLGLTGFALGFALKDIVSNLLAGVLVILYRTFDEGDRIRVSGFEGKVVRIDLRYTLLDTGPDIVFLPNQMLFNNAVVVVGTEPGSTSEAAVAGG